MSNSLKNDLQLLKELQTLDFQIINSEKNIEKVKKTIDFLQKKILACDNIVSEIHRLNVEGRITFDNIKMIVKSNDLNAEDILNDGDEVNACISKFENLKIKFDEKIKEQEVLLNQIIEEHEKTLGSSVSKKNGIVSILKPDIAKVYNRLFSLFEDKIVLTTIEDNTCSHCHVKTCLQKYVDVLKYENVVYCENCGRILFVA